MLPGSCFESRLIPCAELNARFGRNAIACQSLLNRSVWCDGIAGANKNSRIRGVFESKCHNFVPYRGPIPPPCGQGYFVAAQVTEAAGIAFQACHMQSPSRARGDPGRPARTATHVFPAEP